MKYVTDFNQIDLTKKYTYADYLTWRFIERVELLWGKIKKMTPAPSTRHQIVLGNLYVAMSTSLQNNPCQVFIAPFDVRLPLDESKEDKVQNVVQPDLCVVCDENKIDEKGCNGAPDLIVEVLSPYSSTRDLKDKLNLYEQAGVPEYWVVDPHDGVVHIFILNNHGKYTGRHPVTAEDTLTTEIISGITVDMHEIFPNILEELEEPYGEKVKRI